MASSFFFYNEISPKEKLGPTGRTIEAKLAKKNQCRNCHYAGYGKNPNQADGRDDRITFSDRSSQTKKPLILEKKYRGRKEGSAISVKRETYN